MGEELTIIRKPVPGISPTLRDLLAVLFRQRRVALVFFAGIFLAVFGYGWFAPSYQAHMSVLVRRGRVDPQVTPAPTPSPILQRDEISEEELNSQVELLRDDEILRTVAQVPELAGAPWYERFLGGGTDVRLARSVRRMSRRLTAEAIRKTNLIEVTYSSSDPAQASAVLHALARAYLERQQRVRRPSGEYQFFEQQVAQSRRGLLDAEFRLMDFSSDQGVVSAAQERDMALQKLSDAEANERQTQVAMAETRRRMQDLQSKLKALPERTLTVIRNSDNPQLAEKMKSKLLELQLKRTELLTKFEPSYRLVQEVDQQIAETKSSIAGEEHTPLRDETTNQEPNHEWAKSELIKAQVALGALEARGQATHIQVAGYRDVAQRLGGNALRRGRPAGGIESRRGEISVVRKQAGRSED